MATLYLTPTEQKLFEKLSPELREGWEVEAEKLVFEDTPQKRRIRLSIMRVNDPWMKALTDRVASVNSEQELASLIEGIDLKGISSDDLTEIFFGLGPDALSWPIGAQLVEAASDQDVEAASALSTIRHYLLEQFCSVPA